MRYDKLLRFALITEFEHNQRTDFQFFISQGGYFKAILTFPSDFPYNPPEMKFMSDMWHPNSKETLDSFANLLTYLCVFSLP